MEGKAIYFTSSMTMSIQESATKPLATGASQHSDSVPREETDSPVSPHYNQVSACVRGRIGEGCLTRWMAAGRKEEIMEKHGESRAGFDTERLVMFGRLSYFP